jgi:hypothetical protein
LGNPTSESLVSFLFSFFDHKLIPSKPGVIEVILRLNCIDAEEGTLKLPRYIQPLAGILAKLAKLVCIMKAAFMHDETRISLKDSTFHAGFPAEAHSPVPDIPRASKKSEEEGYGPEHETSGSSSSEEQLTDDFDDQDSDYAGPSAPDMEFVRVSEASLMTYVRKFWHACKTQTFQSSDHEYPINVVSKVFGAARSAAGQRVPVVIETDNKSIFLVNGMVFDLRCVQQAFNSLLERFQCVIDKFRNGIMIDVKGMKEKFDRGFFPMTKELTTVIFQKLLDSEHAFLSVEGTLIFDPVFVKEQFDLADRGMELAVALVQLGGGLAARMTELGQLRWNAAGAEERSLFLHERSIMIAPIYSKNNWRNSKINGDSIRQYRFLPESLSISLLNWRVITENLNCLANHCFPHWYDGRAYRDSLIVISGVVATKAQISDMFKDTCRSVGFNVMPSEFRQLSRYLMDKALIGCRVNARWSANVAAQAGNTAQTASLNYGIVEGEHPRFKKYELELQREISGIWHSQVLGIAPLPVIHMPSPSPSDSSILTRNCQVAVQSEASQSILKGRLFETEDAASSRSVAVVHVERAAVDLLREIHPGSDFTSVAQETGVLLVLDGVKSFVLGLATGGGKTLLVISAVKRFHEKLIILLVPTKSLREQMLVSLSRAGVVTVQLEQISEEACGVAVLCFSTLEKNKGLRNKLFILSERKHIARIFIDEAHDLVCANYRQMDFTCPVLTSFWGTPFTLMTGTPTPRVLKRLHELFCLPDDFMHVIGPLERDNISYRVKRVSDAYNACTVYSELFRLLRPDEKAIIFVTDKSSIDFIRHKVGIERTSQCHADLLDAEFESNIRKWRNGGSQVMVATSAFGVGIDDSSVKLVLFHGLPSSFEEFLQMSGRAGRPPRRLPSESVIVFWTYKCQDQNLIEYVSYSSCRSAFIMTVFGSVGRSCRMRSANKCDFCLGYSQSPGMGVDCTERIDPSPIRTGHAFVEGRRESQDRLAEVARKAQVEEGSRCELIAWMKKNYCAPCFGKGRQFSHQQQECQETLKHSTCFTCFNFFDKEKLPRHWQTDCQFTDLPRKACGRCWMTDEHPFGNGCSRFNTRLAWLHAHWKNFLGADWSSFISHFRDALQRELGEPKGLKWLIEELKLQARASAFEMTQNK